MAKVAGFLCTLGLLVIFSAQADSSILSNLFKGASSILHKGEETIGKYLSNITSSTSNNVTAENCYDELGCFSMKAPWTSILRPLPPPMSPTKLNTRLYCFTRDLPQQYNVTFWPTISLGGLPFDGNKTTVFISHGFVNNANATWCREMKDAYLSAVDANVCLVDWGVGATMLNYLQVASNTRMVGAELARFIRYLQQNYGLTPGNLHFIGHSLGAHISAYAAKNFTGVKRITALDPAQPGFEFCDKAVRLDKDDALFVDAIHTNAAPFIPTLGFGMMTPTAHVDFYVNGGLRQPGCALPSVSNIKSILDLAYYPVEMVSMWVICSHSRAIDYFISSLNSSCFIWGRTCSLRKHMLRGTLLGFIDPTFSNVETCTSDTCIPMGLDTSQYDARGIFAVATPSTTPYCDTKEENSKILTDILNTAAKVKSAVSGAVNKTIDIAEDVIESFDNFKEDIESKVSIVFNNTAGSITEKLLKFKGTLLKIG